MKKREQHASADERETLPEDAAGGVASDDGQTAAPGGEDAPGRGDGETAEAKDAPLTPEQEAEKWRDAALRAQAALENFRKRAERERLDAVRYANGSMLEGLLPVLDHFDLGLEAARKESGQEVLVQGMTMVRNQLEEFLRTNQVETIDAEGGEFDHHLHEAMSQEPSDAVEQGRVLRQVRRGYRLRDRLLRPAAVIVSSGPPEEAMGEPDRAEAEGE